jgi:hypothetical protein
VIVTTPTDKWMRAKLACCRSSFHVASPYIGSYLPEVLNEVTPATSVTILTRTRLLDFASAASDFDAVCELAGRFGGLLSSSSLHAKVYVADCRIALVTSANATYSGMHRNLECGLEITDGVVARELSQKIESGFDTSHLPQKWTLSDLETLRLPIAALRAALPKRDRLSRPDFEAPQPLQIARKNLDRLVASFSGWKQLVLECLIRLNSTVFTLEDIYRAAEPRAREVFPENKNVRAKIRQQLQVLRDLGLIRFVSRGRYELLTTAA